MTVNPLALIRIVDDELEMRKSLEFLLSTAGWRSKSYSSAEEFLTEDNELIPGCLLLDVRMPRTSGLELHETLSWRNYSLPIIFITAHGDIDMAVRSIKKGAFDFLQKPIDDDRLLDSVAKAVALDWECRSKQMNISLWKERYAQLTEREKEVAVWVATGLLNKTIGDKLGIGEKTVQVHRGAVCRKLQVRSAVAIAKILTAIDINVPEV